MGSGGRREGAGRKALENKKVQMVITITPETRSLLKNIANAEGITPGRLIERLISKL